MSLIYDQFNSPVGTIYIVCDNLYIRAVLFKKNWKTYRDGHVIVRRPDNQLIRNAKKQFAEYFSGKRRQFSLKCKPQGTDFQIKVWNALRKIPFGKTKSYKEQAKLINNAKAARAIGRADSQNPICIVYPCHRVIGSNGKLTGFAGGLKIKKQLLRLEGALK